MPHNAAHAAPAVCPLVSMLSGPIRGELTPPGDKSISHRSIMLGGVAEGVTTVRGLLEGEDVLCTMAALREVGAITSVDTEGTWHIKGVGLQGLRAPQRPLDMGNSGTAARLLMGLLSGRPFASTFVGDASLSKRPMARVITPLSEMGARFESREGRMPLTVTGLAEPRPITYNLPVASAQVKSAILLAGLSAKGTTTVIEKTPTRDHSENMLRAFGVPVKIEKLASGEEAISVEGPAQLKAQNIVVPSDISSAAFPIVAALIRPGSSLLLKNVGINPRRAGLLQTLIEMGGKITLANKRVEGGEPVADIVVEGCTLHGVTVPADRAASMIDEYPVLSIAAACAVGTTRMLGLHELRVKESDRLAQVAKGLAVNGVQVKIEGDDLIVEGNGLPPPGGGLVETAMDHRIAMSFLVMGTAAQNPVTVDDGSFITTSFPGFVEKMNKLGFNIQNA